MTQAYLDYCDKSTSLRGAAFLAENWHSGQWSSLYMLSCYVYGEWTKEDIEGMISEFQDIPESDEDSYEAQEAIEALQKALELY